jgi:hypothetical protein
MVNLFYKLTLKTRGFSMRVKSIIFILSMSVILFGVLIPLAYSANYVVTNISNYNCDDPQINNNGQVVWHGLNGPVYEMDIYLYDGTSVRNISNMNHFDWYPQINDNGKVVWWRDDNGNDEIYLYDGTSVINLSNSVYSERFARISNSGVVWTSGVSPDSEIYLYDWITVTRITNNGYGDGSPQINNSGQVVWSGGGEIYLYDGASITNISNNIYPDNSPQINENGQVVWMMGAWPDYEIYLYDGTTVNNISNNSYHNYDPQININGQVVWMVDEGSDYEIYLYDGATVTNISNSPYDDMFPQINDNGYVVWAGFNGSSWDIYLYDGIAVTNISNGAYSQGLPPQINNNNYVVWEGDGKIYLAIPSSQAVEVISPNGGELIPSGSTYPVRWGASSEAVKFTLRYSINNGATWKVIASNVTGTSYYWGVPVQKNNKTNCLVKVTGYNASGVKIGEDTSNGTFTIEVVKVTSPDGGEVLNQGNPWTITWRTNRTIRPVASVKLLYSINGGSTWKLIKTITGNPGSYNSTVPYVSSSSCKVKVVLKDAGGVTLGSDISDGVFSIQP